MSSLLEPFEPWKYPTSACCEHTGNQCGTDTVALGYSCGCRACCTYYERAVNLTIPVAVLSAPKPHITAALIQRASTPMASLLRIDKITTPPNTPLQDWIIENVSAVSFINEGLLASVCTNRRKAGRKIRQQRRKLRRINQEFGHGPNEGVPESILRSKISL